MDLHYKNEANKHYLQKHTVFNMQINIKGWLVQNVGE